MANGNVQLPSDGVGKKVDTSQVTVASQVVHRQRVVIADDTNPDRFAKVDANGLLQVAVLSGVSTGLTDAELRASPVPVSFATPIDVALASVSGFVPVTLEGSGVVLDTNVINTASVNLTQVNGNAIVEGAGGVGLGCLRVAPTNETFQDAFVTGLAGMFGLGDNILLAGGTSQSTNTVAVVGVSFRSFYCQIVGSAGIASGAVTFEGSNDNVTFTPLAVFDDASVSGAPITIAQSIAASTNRYFSGRIDYRYIRCRISTAFSGGTVQAFVRYSTGPHVSRTVAVSSVPANATTNITQLNGTSVSRNTGAADNGTLRVALANESLFPDKTQTGFNTTSVSSQWNLLETSQTTAGTDVLGYNSLSVQLNGVAVTTTTVVFEGSNDNSTYSPIQAYDRQNQGAAPTSSITTNGSPMAKLYDIPIYFRYIRLRITALTGTSVQAIWKASYAPYSPTVITNNVSHLGGGATNTNNGTASSGTLRVAIASDNTANSNPFLVTVVPSASQGVSNIHHAISANTTNATSVKASAGTISILQVSNINAAVRYFKLYNKSSAPTVGTDTPVLTLLIPPNSNAIIECGPSGLRLNAGIAYALTTGITVADATAVGANEHSVSITYI